MDFHISMNTNNILYEIFQNPNYLLNGFEIIFNFSSSYINNINGMENPSTKNW